jgi:hypothetical protein
MSLFVNMQKRNRLGDQDIYMLLDRFIDASLEMPIRRVRDLFEDTRYYTVIFGYFLGAVEYMKKHKDLSQRDIRILFKKFFSYGFVKYDKEKELYQMFVQLQQRSEEQDYMNIGRNAFKRWLESREELVPDLNRLIFSMQVKKDMF